MNLRDFLKNDLKERKISKQVLADELGISYVMLYLVLTGRQKAGNKTLRGIAKNYGLDIIKVVEMNDKE